MRHPDIDLLERVFERALQEFSQDERAGYEDVPNYDATVVLLRLMRDLLTLHLEVEQGIGMEDDDIRTEDLDS
jgi:hypothetical protein